MFKKYIKISLVVFLVVLITYTFAWLQLYNTSKKYYSQAMTNYNNSNYIIALKGKQVLKADSSGYEFQGGFEEVTDEWDSSYAFPKPEVYYKSKIKIDSIIDEKMDEELGQEIFKQYFQLDNEYLGRILNKVGDLYLKSGDISDAKDTYQTVTQAFPNDDLVLKQANDKLKAIQKSNK